MRGTSRLTVANVFAALIFGATLARPVDFARGAEEPQRAVVVCPAALIASQTSSGAREGVRTPVPERGEVDVETPLGQVRAVLGILEELKAGRRADSERYEALIAALESHDARVQERFDALCVGASEGEAKGEGEATGALGNAAKASDANAAIPTAAVAAAIRREATRWTVRWATRALVFLATFVLAGKIVDLIRRRIQR